jgi:hypothetical protein
VSDLSPADEKMRQRKNYASISLLMDIDKVVYVWFNNCTHFAQHLLVYL